jgi:hypothetical protein
LVNWGQWTRAGAGAGQDLFPAEIVRFESIKGRERGADAMGRKSKHLASLIAQSIDGIDNIIILIDYSVLTDAPNTVPVPDIVGVRRRA